MKRHNAIRLTLALFLFTWLSAGWPQIGFDLFTTRFNFPPTIQVAQAAFPTVDATAVSGDSGAGTSHTVTLPSGIVSGDLLIVIISIDSGGANEFTWPGVVGDWTELFDHTRGSGGYYSASAAYRRADGTEGSTITVTSATSDRTSWNAYRISGHHDTSDPESAVIDGSDTTPDPPSLDPTGWGAEDTLWIAGAGIDKPSTTAPATDLPDNYTDMIEYRAISDNWTISLRRELNATADDPTTFTIGATDQWVAFTIAIRPATAVVCDPPGDPGYVGANAQSGQATVYWSSANPVLILRKTTAFAGEAPTDGQTYTAGVDTIGAADVVYNGSVAETSFTQTGLTNGTTYSYKVFPKESTPCYAPGVEVNASFESGSQAAITYEEVQTGSVHESSTLTSVTTSASLTAVADHLYLAAISTKPDPVVNSVTGLDLTWTLVKAQCGTREQSRTEIWWAQGTPTAGTVTANFTSYSGSAVIAVHRYSGVDTTTPIGNSDSANTLGVGGACPGAGTDTDNYSFATLDTSQANSVVFVAAGERVKTHTAGAEYTERADIQSGTGGGTAGVATEEQLFASATTDLTVSGSFSGTTDWSVVAVEINPNASPGGEPAWAYMLEGGSILKAGITGEGTIYATSNAQRIMSLSTTDGTQSWEPVATTAAVQGWLTWLPGSGGTVIGGDQGGQIYSVDTVGGATNWQPALTGADAVQAATAAQLRAYSNAAFQAAYTGDVIFAATLNASTTDNKLFALQRSDAAVLWTFNANGTDYDVDSIEGMPYVDYARNRVYVASRAGAANQRSLWVIDSLNGNVVACANTDADCKLGHLQTSPTLSYDGTTIYVANTAGELYAIDVAADPPAFKWTGTHKVALGTAINGFVWEDWSVAGRLYFSTADGKAWCLDDPGAGVGPPAVPPDLPQSSCPWNSLVNASGVSTPLLLDKLFVGSSDGKVHQINLSTGVDEKQFTVGDGSKTVGDVSTETGNEIFVPTTEGKLYRIDLVSGELP